MAPKHTVGALGAYPAPTMDPRPGDLCMGKGVEGQSAERMVGGEAMRTHKNISGMSPASFFIQTLM